MTQEMVLTIKKLFLSRLTDNENLMKEATEEVSSYGFSHEERLSFLSEAQKIRAQHQDKSNDEIIAELQREIEEHYKEKANENAFVFGQAGPGRAIRCFEESEFRLDLVPDYVNVLQLISDPNTGKRYVRYTDTYGQGDVDEELSLLNLEPSEKIE